MLKRSPFRSKLPPARPAKQYDGASPNSPRTPSLRVDDGKARLVVPIPKGEKAKPGKRTPTVAEAAWMDAIVAYGCIACRLDGFGQRPAAVHHILRGGQRMGHLFTLPLCDPGHHQQGASLGLVSRHPWKARFEAKYGSELDLLEALRTTLKVAA